MRGIEAWVTTAVEDKDVMKVLVLASSLRRSLTTKKLVVLESPTLEEKNKSLLRKAFDQVFCFDHHSVNGWIALKDYAKLYCLNLTLFRKCVYLAPETLVLKNCDELFDLAEDFNAVVSRAHDGGTEVDTAVFCFSPSVQLFERLVTNGKTFVKAEAGQLDAYLKRWMLNQKTFGALDSKYNFQLTNKNVATSDFSIAKLPDDVSEKLLSSGLLQYDGIMESGAIKFWRYLYEVDVLLKLCGKKLVPTMTADSPISTMYDFQSLQDSIAIVGISCRHPGADNLSEFQQMLMNGLSGICPVPMDRWTKDHGCKGSSTFESTRGGFICSPLDRFDSRFFGISPKEMEYLDPQQRLLLEVSYEALENAGMDPMSLRNSHTGIFVGAWTNDYKNLLMKADCDEFYRIYMGNSFGAAAARLSFFLGLTGPSVATESGCSSAMQSVDLACKSLRNGETSVSLACGVNLLLQPFNKDLMPFVLAGDSLCKTFDEAADGFGRAEACSVLVLKRYADAVKENDHIYALIRGSSCVQEGVSRSMGTPTKECEALAMSLALKDAGVNPKDVSFIEAHGTGTPLGDPLEISAIAEVYGGVDRKEPLIIGSVKTNIGHTESCSGITGIIKVVASLQNEMIPQHLNLNKLNPKINLGSIPAKIPLEPLPWPRNGNKPRLAGVSSFGITGTDGHLILQEAPVSLKPNGSFIDIQDRSLHILKLSARSEDALDAMLAQYQEYLGQQENSTFPDICYTANRGRASSFPHRAVIIAKDCQDACQILQAKKYSRNETPEDTSEKICFLFTGQGSQYPGMAKQLYETSPVFRMNFDKCQKIVLDKFGLNVKGSMWGSNAGFELSRSLYSQTGIFCVEYCLLKLWESWGIKPDYVVGHSLGEFAAAVAAGALTFEDALMLVVERSRLVESLPEGKMLVLKADQNCADLVLKEFATLAAPGFWLDYAAVNSKEQTVLAGLSHNVDTFAKFCSQEKNIKIHILDASHAYHSRLMDPILEKYEKVVKLINRDINIDRSTSCKFISGVYGKLMDDHTSILSPKYWIDHCREKVSFIQACQAMATEKCKYFLEIGPQPVLSPIVIANTESGLTCVPSIRRNEENWKTVLGSLAKLYTSGWSVEWKGFDKYYPRSVVPTLPTYPFQRKRFWFDTQNMKGSNFMNNGESIHPLLGTMVSNASGVKIFQNGVDLRKRVEWIKDHCVGKRILFPGAGFLEMCLSAGHCVTDGLTESFCKPIGPLTIENFKILAPLALDEKLVCQMQVVLHSNNSKEEDINNSIHDGMKIQVFRQHFMEGEPPKWTEHCTSYFTPAPVHFDEIRFREVYNFGKIKELCTSKLDIDDIYEKLAEVGLKFGTGFQSLERIWKGDNGILAEAKVPQGEDQKNYILHPVLLDAMLQAAMVVQSKGQIERLHVPIGIKKFTWLQHEDLGTPDSNTGSLTNYFIYSTPHHEMSCDNSTDIISVLFSGNEENGNKIIAFMIGMEFAETTVQAIESHLDSQTADLPNFFQEVWKPMVGPNQARLRVSDIFKVDLFHHSSAFSNIEQVPVDMVREGLIETLCYGYVLNAFSELGWDPTVGETFSLDQFISSLKISPQHKKLVRYHLKMLSDNGILEFVGDTDLKVLKLPPPVIEVHKLIRNTNNNLEKYENTSNSLQIYNSCGTQLGPILQGKASALPILFPQDPTQPSAESFYTESYSYSGMDINVINHFKKLLKPYDPNTKGILRVLEAGAGTGNFSRDILNIFREHGVGIEYTFTDISPAFFINAAKKFEDFKDVIKYQILNIESDAKLQGFSEYFDIVVAADVFHATKSLADSVSNVRQLLKPGGLLCIIEGALQNHITCIFGLLEGYWRYTDTDIRQHHPLVSCDTWKNLCLDLGFDQAVSTPCCSGFYTFVIARASESLPKIMLPIISSQEGKWLVFPTLDNESKHLIEKLSLYRSVITVWRSHTYQESDDGSGFGINVNHKDHMTKMMQSIKEKSNTVHIEGILYLWGLSAGANTDQAEIAQPFLNLCQTVVEMKQQQIPKFFLVTSGICLIGDHPCTNPAGSTLWGIARSSANELNMRIKMIDVCPLTKESGPQGGVDNAEDIFYELWNETPDLFIAYREKTRYFGRLMKTKVTEKALKLPQSDRFHLILPQTKAIADLKFGTLGKYVLKEDEVEVEVKSCALNFRDVFAVLKPDKQFESINVVGSDFAGIVSAVGSQVEKWKVGDAVFGCNLENGALPSHVRINDDAIVKKPEFWTFAEACGIPAVFATAYYSLVTVAKMKAGDTVLVHTASGGVGLSAIQICKHIGAKVIATAGSSRKRAYLKSIGIRHVFHSRNTKYEKDIMKVTGGRGVDLVLNSLTSPGFKEASLNVCKKGARFVEMSKLSVWQPEEVKMLRPDVDYTIVDLTSVSRDVWKMLFATIDELLKKGVVMPIPYVRFDGVFIREALTFLQKAKHIGKIVCIMPEIKFQSGQYTHHTPLFNPESTYLITGGLGGIGFEVAKWMVESQGATNLVIVSRSQPKERHMQVIKALRAQNKNIVAKSVDVGDPTMCKNLMDYLKDPSSKLPPLRGIMHCAGVLSDATLINQSWEKFLQAFRPKVKGAWNLHEVTRDCNLEHFVMFSSMAALFGPPGQSNHAAGNGYLDSLTCYRDSIGLPATTVNWGQWGQVGVAAGREVRGVVPFSPARGIASLEAIMRSQMKQTAVVDLDFQVLMKVHPQSKAYLQHVVVQGSSSEHSAYSSIKSEKFWEEVDSAKEEDKPAVIKRYVKVLLRQILKLDDEEPIDDNANFQDMGLDSLMMIELKNNLQTILGSRMTFAASALADCTNIELLSDKLIEQMNELSYDAENNSHMSSKALKLNLEEMWELVEEDSELPASIQFTNAHQSPPKLSTAKVFLLTGLTGNLGPYILKELLSYKQVEKVYCLMRKTKNPQQRVDQVMKAMKLEKHLPKIQLVIGDLVSPKFSLNDNEWDNLSSEVDAVIHCAVKSNHVEIYGRNPIRVVNVTGTLRVLEFCANQKIKYLFHSSSIVAVSTTDEDGCLSEDWPIEGELKGVTDLAYPISKMICDRLVHQAVKRGLPAKVFRFGGLIGNSKSGQFKHQNNHLMLRFLCYMKLGAMPSVPVPCILLPVDLAAAASIEIFFDESDSADIYNISHPNPALEQEFPILAQEFGYDVEVVDYNEFVNRFSTEGEDSLLHPFRELYENEERYNSLLSFPDAIRKWLESPDTFFSVRKVTKVIPDYTQRLSPTWEYVRRDLLYAKGTGLFEKFRLTK